MFECDICDYTADRRNKVLRHIKVHSKNKPYRKYKYHHNCDECKYSTNHKGSFTRHIKYHRARDLISLGNTPLVHKKNKSLLLILNHSIV
jgi:hypothetical protein